MFAACWKPEITKLYFSPTFVVVPFIVAFISDTFVIFLVIFPLVSAVVLPSITTEIFDTVVYIAETLSKYLSVISNCTVKVLAVLSITVFANLYVNVGGKKSNASPFIVA